MQKTILTPEGHCYIHFDTTGIDAPDLEDQDLDGIPDFINEVSLAADSAYTLLVETMNYNDGANGINNITDIFVIELYGSSYGWTRKVDDSCNDSCVELDNNYDEGEYYTHGVTAMQVTLIHEYFHTIQLEYQCNTGSDSYFYELTSTWIEDVGYPDINDYLNFMTQSNSVNNYYKYPEQNFDNTNGYSAAWFGHYLSTQYDNIGGITHVEELESVIMRKIWERIAVSGSSALNIVDYILENDYNSSFIEAWVEFNSRNLFNQIDESFYYYQDQALIDPIITSATIEIEDSIYIGNYTVNNKSVEIQSFSMYQPGILDININSSSGNHFGNIVLKSLEENSIEPIFYGNTDPITDSDKLYFVLSTTNDSQITTTIDLTPSFSPLPPEEIFSLTAPDYVDIWWDPSPGPGDTLYYIIFRDGDSIFSTTDTAITDTGLDEFTEYLYEIAAVNYIGQSELKTITINTGEPDYPTEPDELFVLADWDEINLLWSSSSGPGTSISYTIFRNNDSLVTVEDTTFLDISIDPSTNYKYDLYSVNRIGKSVQPRTLNTTTWPSPENINETELLTVYPNPVKFQEIGSLTIIIDSESEINSGTFRIYDLLGREVTVWQDIILEKGRQRITFNGLGDTPVASGLYFISYQPPGKKLTSIPVMIIH